MKGLLKDWLIALACAALVWLGVTWFRSRPDLPEFAPALVARDLDGGTFDLSARKGHTVVLNFWASWCGPCRSEIPEFTSFARAHPELDVVGVAVESGDAGQVRAAAKALGIGYRVALADERISGAWDVDTLPTTVIVGPDGRIRSARVGAMSYRALERAVAAD